MAELQQASTHLPEPSRPCLAQAGAKSMGSSPGYRARQGRGIGVLGGSLSQRGHVARATVTRRLTSHLGSDPPRGRRGGRGAGTPWASQHSYDGAPGAPDLMTGIGWVGLGLPPSGSVLHPPWRWQTAHHPSGLPPGMGGWWWRGTGPQGRRGAGARLPRPAVSGAGLNPARGALCPEVQSAATPPAEASGY